MRVTSEFWVSAYIRKRMAEGTFVGINNKGSAEAGAIAVKVARLDGTASLYLPAPQFVFSDKKPLDRQFICELKDQPERDVDARLESERRFDMDIWIVEVEDRAGVAMLDVIELD